MSLKPDWQEFISECKIKTRTQWVHMEHTARTLFCTRMCFFKAWLFLELETWQIVEELFCTPCCEKQCFLCFCHQAGTTSYVYADSSRLQGFAAWSPEVELNSRLSPTTNSSCVELLSTGTWSRVECEATMFFICEFPKSRRRGGGRWASQLASS